MNNGRQWVRVRKKNCVTLNLLLFSLSDRNDRMKRKDSDKNNRKQMCAGMSCDFDFFFFCFRCLKCQSQWKPFSFCWTEKKRKKLTCITTIVSNFAILVCAFLFNIDSWLSLFFTRLHFDHINRHTSRFCLVWLLASTKRFPGKSQQTYSHCNHVGGF